MTIKAMSMTGQAVAVGGQGAKTDLPPRCAVLASWVGNTHVSAPAAVYFSSQRS